MISRRMILAGYVACIEEKCMKGCSGETWKKETTGRPRHRWRLVLKWILKKQNGRAWAQSISSEVG
jgi:hypothetical protein